MSVDMPETANAATDLLADVSFDDEKFPDAMGWRAKPVVLTPAPTRSLRTSFTKWLLRTTSRTSRRATRIDHSLHMSHTKSMG